MFEYEICHHVALRANAIFYEIQNFTLVDLFLKLASPASIFNIQREKQFKIIFCMVVNLNHQHFVSSLSYAKKYKYVYIVPRYLGDTVVVNN